MLAAAVAHLNLERLVCLALHDTSTLSLEGQEDQLPEGILESPDEVHEDVRVHLEVAHEGHQRENGFLHLGPEGAPPQSWNGT